MKNLVTRSIPVLVDLSRAIDGHHVATTPAPTQHAPKKRRPGQFTLIELLVVVAIIAILSALLLPSLRHAREAGYAVLCLNNMRTIGTGFFMHSGDRDGELPHYDPHDVKGVTTTSTADNLYNTANSPQLLIKAWPMVYHYWQDNPTHKEVWDNVWWDWHPPPWYLRPRIDAYRCPSNEARGQRGGAQFGGRGYWHYGIIYSDILQQWKDAGNPSRLRLTDLQPNFMMLMELNNNHPTGTAGAYETPNCNRTYYGYFAWDMYGWIWDDRGPPKPEYGMYCATTHHNGGMNALFPDGSGRRLSMNTYMPHNSSNNFRITPYIGDTSVLR